MGVVRRTLDLLGRVDRMERETLENTGVDSRDGIITMVVCVRRQGR